MAWLYVYGEEPPEFLDHKDGDKANNRIENLRPADRSQPSEQRPSTRNTSGFKGVSPSKRGQRYNAKKIHLGTYDTPQEAHATYLSAAKAAWGEYARAE